MNTQALLDVIRLAVPGNVEPGQSTDQPTIFVAREALLPVSVALREHPNLHFEFLADITAVDWYPREPRFEVVYILASIDTAARKRLRMKVRVPGQDPHVPSIASVWPSAGWAEREVFDLFGIIFDGHQDLRRILMPEDWEGYPLRKDYPVQIRMAPKTQEPLQLSPEQFAANIRADRER
ncbi:MAG TPA: NADH-quinone oxidoreductase subunit C [Vicinamibacterales bacterium]|jgi:NADH-quinone oxidoreductase subunit C|nr:NADH-quinone oxidoreductase subunit C [Vicinamibacterales bacterium]